MAGKKKLQEQALTATEELFDGMRANEQQEVKESVKTAQEAPQQEIKQQAIKKMFSFRTAGEHVDMWKAYIEATGRKAEDVSDAAIMEYMKRHKLSDAQQEVYDLKLKLIQARSKQ